MRGEKLELVKEAVSAAVGHLSEEDRAALIVYDHEVEILQTLDSATPRIKTAIRLALKGVDHGGSTNLSGGWLTGCQELAKYGENGSRIQRSLLLTDGLANVGITNNGELAEHASQLRKRGISTTAIGVGLGFDEELLTAMAEAGGGNFQFIADSKEMRSFFERELGELLTIVATGLRLHLTLPHGVRAKLVNAFPVERFDKRLEIAVGDLPATDELHLVFEVTTSAGQINTTHVARLAGEWADIESDSRQSFDIALPALTLAHPSLVADVPFDREVTEEVALQRSAADQREAMRLDRQGRMEESRAKLLAAQGYLAAAPTSARVSASIGDMAQLLAAPMSAPYSEEVRKRVTYDAHRRQRGKSENNS
jgi:Ca-activated chloride channel family protein